MTERELIELIRTLIRSVLAEGKPPRKPRKPRKSGFRATTLRCLEYLKTQPRGAHLTIIAEDLGISTVRVSSQCGRLVKAGLVRRKAEGFFEAVQ